jgi:phosphoserine phosphatase RsbU/P
MKKLQLPVVFFLTVIILLIVYFTFYKDVQLLAGLKTTYDNTEILHKADLLVHDFNAPVNNLQKSYGLQANQGLIKQVEGRYGYKKGNELLRTSLPGFYWRIKWQKASRSNISFGVSERDDRTDNTTLRIVYDCNGNLIEYYESVNDSAEIPSISDFEARIKVKKFLSGYFKIDNGEDTASPSDSLLPPNYFLTSPANEILTFSSEKKIIYSHRTDYIYSWHGKSAYIDDSIKVNVTISGNKISGYNISYVIPDKYSDVDSNVYQGIITIAFYFVVIILIGLIAYKKIRAYEIGFKLAFIVTAVVAVSLCIHLYVIITDEMGWAILFPLVFGPVFYGGLVFITWAAGETVTREIWKEKFSSLDLISKGYFFNKRIGESLLTGISAGFTLVIIQMFIMLIAQNFTAVTCNSYYSALLSTFNSFSYSIAVLSTAIYYPIFLVTIFLTFVVSGLRERVRSSALLVIVAGIIWGIVNSGEINPSYVNILVDIITGLIIVWIYYKYDVLASIITVSSLLLTSQGLILLSAGHATYALSAYVLIFVLALIIVYGFIAFLSGKVNVDVDDITPAFVKNITERERLQRELEIAKEVQMSFLPRTDPNFPGVEIASRCVPALEVGGDYYDFVISSDKKIGIIIGDVSGKGTQAAFYMTLTKGFLKALSRIAYTPANFLTELNSLFYENVERGTFISMVYGILDTENKTFTLARAGHNPVIVKNSAQGKSEFLNSSGLALGLEKGPVFSKNIKEIEITVASGDVLVFYTDGFTEAMNKLNEEFGEKRLVASVEENSGLHAQQILDNIFNEVQSFIGKADQHDDMTMVVVKVI